MGFDRPMQGRALALAVAAAVHAAVLAAFLWRLGAAPAYPEPPVMTVEITRLWPPLRPERAAEAPPPGPRAPAAPPILHQPPVSGGAPPIATAPAPSPGALPDVLKRTLRGALGCRHPGLAGLTEAERRGCEERLAAGGQRASPVRLDLDPAGHFAEDPTPYLARKPKTGCKLMAGGGADPMGKQGPVGGVGCRWTF